MTAKRSKSSQPRDAGKFGSVYDPSLADKVPDLMAEGRTLAAVARECGCSLRTIYNWRDEHPEFAAALALGEALSAAWWEDRLRDCAMDGTPAVAVIFGLKNRAPELWRDKQEHEHTGGVTITRVELVDGDGTD